MYYLLLILCALSLTGCTDAAYDYNKSLTFINRSNQDIAIQLGGVSGGVIYPDTTLPIYKITHLIRANDKIEYDRILKYPQDSIYLFVLNPDTITKYTWEQIREDYNIIKRYELSWKRLAETNNIVTYP